MKASAIFTVKALMLMVAATLIIASGVKLAALL